MATRLFGLRLAAAALLVLGTASNALAEKDIKVGLALPQNIQGFDHVNGMYETFKKEVETATKGELKVEIVYGGALGNPNDRMVQMRRGIIQMSDASDGNFATIYPRHPGAVDALSVPQRRTAWEVFDGPFGQEMAEDIAKATGIRVLGWWEAGGFRQYSANSRSTPQADMAGLKMRVWARPTPSRSRRWAARRRRSLQRALHLAQDRRRRRAGQLGQGVPPRQALRGPVILILSGHSYAFGPLGIYDAFYNGLEPEQAAIEAAAKMAIDYNRKTSRKGEARRWNSSRTRASP